VIRREAEQASIDLIEHFRLLLERRRVDRRRDLMSVLLSVAERTGDLADNDILALCIQLLVAGWQATPNFLANGVAILLRHPEELARLRRDPGLIPAAVEELLRFDPVIRLVTRVASEDIELDGKRIGRGQRVALLLAASGRDPGRYADPDRLDVGRPESNHLALGYGIHFCLGAALARMLAEITFGALLERRTPEQLAAMFERAPEYFFFPRPMAWQ
jgi:cytochrome P450